MKSERRHHLQQNELAGHLGRARHWIEPYTVPLLAAVVVVVVGVILIGFYRSRAANQRSDATLGLLLSTAREDAEAYHLVSTDFAGTAPAVIATLAKADAFLSEGIDAMYSDRELAQARLDDAIAAYRNVLDEANTTLLQSRAYFGLAKAYQTQGDLDAAIEAYQQVIELNESEAMVEVAEERIAALERPSTHEFVSWFAEQKPEAFDPGTPPGMPDAGSLPEMPDFTLPGLDPTAADPTAADPLQSDSAPLGEPLEPTGDDAAVDDRSAENPEIAIPEEGDVPEEGGEPAADAADEAVRDDAEASEGSDIEEIETDEGEPTEQAENVQP